MIHKVYEATMLGMDRKVKYEIIAHDQAWYIIYSGYIVQQVQNEDNVEGNLEAAKKWLFAKQDRTFKEIQ